MKGDKGGLQCNLVSDGRLLQEVFLARVEPCNSNSIVPYAKCNEVRPIIMTLGSHQECRRISSYTALLVPAPHRV
jgi:hypothetical protein